MGESGWVRAEWLSSDPSKRAMEERSGAFERAKEQSDDVKEKHPDPEDQRF